MHLRVGIFGGGVVGGGTYELVTKCLKNGRFTGLGASMEVTKICVRSLDKPRDFAVDSAKTTFVTNYDDILNDDSINTVVELMGGVTNAKDVVFQAIAKGKHVITANKALIAQHMDELNALLAANPTVKFGYEAAVCGGIPVIHSLQSDYFSDTVNSVMGIMNGTTNFMLCKMKDEGADYGDVLAEAQRLGFAEADPTADVEGLDVQAKISILTKLTYGKTIVPDTVPTKGISAITSIDFEYASLLKSTIKLIGCAKYDKNDNKVAVFVSPMMVPLSHALASAQGPGNMVVLDSENLGTSSMAGPGAGRFPTANSVLNDMIRLSTDRIVHPALPLQDDSVSIDNDYTAVFYIRINAKDGLGIIKSVGEAAEATGVSINAILQNPITNRASMDFVVATEEVKLSNIEAFCAAIDKTSWSNGAPFYMPIIQ